MSDFHPLSDDEMLAWRHCPRRYWLERHAARGQSLRTIDDAATLAALRATWPRARYLSPPSDEAGWRQAIEQTQAWLAEGYPMGDESQAILGACLQSNDGGRARIDVISPGKRGLRIARVRLATAGNDDDLDLVAWWAHIAARCGARVQATLLMLIEPDFVYPGHGCLAGVFREVDISPLLGSRAVPQWMVAMRQQERGQQPALPLELTCVHVGEGAPPCPHLAHCGLQTREGWAVDALEVLGREQADVLRAQGHRNMASVPEQLLPDDRRLIAWRAVRRGQPEIDPAIRSILLALPRPWHLLRVDTIGHALPIWAGTRPYQVLPFQWTCDEVSPQDLSQTQAQGHFLARGREDPRGPFARSLLTTLKGGGTVLAYNAGFERNRLRELARALPDLAADLDQLQPRIVDLFQLMRRHAYHPQMRGSWSFKSVCHAFVPELAIERFSDTHPTVAHAYVHAMQDRLAQAEVSRLHDAIHAHGRREVLALRRILLQLLLPGARLNHCMTT